MPRPLTIARERWLGFRWHGHGLDRRDPARPTGGERLDDLLLLGFQDSRSSGAQQSLIQRTGRIGSTGIPDAIRPDGPLVTLWSVRGAPHAHPLARLDLVRDALAPVPSDEGGMAHVEAVEVVAAALHAVVTAPIPKSTASTEVTRRVPASLVKWCPRCRADHVPDALFRAAGCQALIVLGPTEDRATMLYPTPEHPAGREDNPRRTLLDAYLRVNGPTSRAQVRTWADGGTRTAPDLWDGDGDGVAVRIDGRRAELPEALVDALTAAPLPEGAVLVPPHDPYLRQVDRTLLVPDGPRRHEVYRALSAPGVLLVDGEVAGTWRYRRGDRELTVTAFDPLPRGLRTTAEDSAARIADATGDDRPTVTWT